MAAFAVGRRAIDVLIAENRIAPEIVAENAPAQVTVAGPAHQLTALIEAAESRACRWDRARDIARRRARPRLSASRSGLRQARDLPTECEPGARQITQSLRIGDAR